MTTQTKLMTAGELAQLPEDGWRYELVAGELHKMALEGVEHGAIVMKIGWRLAEYVETNRLGAIYAAGTGFHLATNPDTVRAADIAFVQQEHIAATETVSGYRSGAPDLAVEVISPPDLYGDVISKLLDWLNAGTRMVILVEPHRRRVNVYRPLKDITVLTINDELTGGDVVPGWALPVSVLFAPPAAG